jgi:uncharacterized protein YbjT (DUF2867 family)
MYDTYMSQILVTGATGTVGSAVVRGLTTAGQDVRPASRSAAPGGSSTRIGDGAAVGFDFTDPRTWAAAFHGVEVVFAVRPPQLSNVHRDMVPALEAARTAGVTHVVFLSVQGAERIPVLPHAAVERWLRHSGLGWTFLRAAYFMQNLSTTHATDVRDRDAVIVPAGSGRTSFVDAEDVASVAVQALLHPADHRGLAWTPTGPAALGYADVARTLTAVLGREIRYSSPGVRHYWKHARRTLGMGVGLTAVTTGIYTAARLGLAAAVTDDVEKAAGHAPTSFVEFAQRERRHWLRSPDEVG